MISDELKSVKHLYERSLNEIRSLNNLKRKSDQCGCSQAKKRNIEVDSDHQVLSNQTPIVVPLHEPRLDLEQRTPSISDITLAIRADITEFRARNMKAEFRTNTAGTKYESQEDGLLVDVKISPTKWKDVVKHLVLDRPIKVHKVTAERTEISFPLKTVGTVSGTISATTRGLNVKVSRKMTELVDYILDYTLYIEQSRIVLQTMHIKSVTKHGVKLNKSGRSKCTFPSSLLETIAQDGRSSMTHDKTQNPIFPPVFREFKIMATMWLNTIKLFTENDATH